MLLKVVIFLLFVPLLGSSRDTESLEIMIDKSTKHKFFTSYRWINDLSLNDLSSYMQENEIIPLRLLGCGAYGCVYRVCYKRNCDIAMKVGFITDEEINNYEKASGLGLVPYLHRSMHYDLPSIQVKGWIILTDFYPLTVADYLDEKFDREPLYSCIDRLKEKAKNHHFYHGDLHLNNIMVGSDLIDLNQRSFKENQNHTDYVPLVFIDLGFSSFNNYSDIWIHSEWKSLGHLL